MTKSEIILMHERLVRERRKVMTEEDTPVRSEYLREIDGLIGRYGQVFNPRIAKKALAWLALV